MDGPSHRVRFGRCAGAGILYLRHSAATVQFVERWVASLTEPSVFDHIAFNELVNEGWARSSPRLHPANNRLFLGMGGNLTLGALPVASFGNGHTFFIQQLHRVRPPGQKGCAGAVGWVGRQLACQGCICVWLNQLPGAAAPPAVQLHDVAPRAVHATHQFGGNLGRRHRMREAMIYEDGAGGEPVLLLCCYAAAPALETSQCAMSAAS
jgi:hypothetical protein